MQSVNNDMDGLFRRAAEDYPLRTDGADWSKVMQGLESSGKKHKPPVNKKDISYLWIAAIALLILCTTYIQRTDDTVEPGRQTMAAGSSNRQNEDTRRFSSEDPISNTDKKSVSVNENNEISLVHKKKPNNASTLVKKQSPFLIPPIEKQVQDQQRAELPQPGVQDQLPENIRDNYSPGEDQVSREDSAQLIAQDKTKKEEVGQDVVITKDKKKKLQMSRPQKLYAGFIAGPDLSTVKSQKVTNAGYTLGLVAGYQFSKRLSLETGILWDRKDYYSSGKHFNKYALGLPQHANVIEVDGYCNMFEIPINLKFNWAQKKKYNLFATTGISSYLMKKEAYDYVYDYYGTQYEYYKNYKNESRNWMSILNMSIGYEKNIGNAGSLRIEPYIKIPLKGVGIGEMPIGSKGILVGFTRPIR